MWRRFSMSSMEPRRRQVYLPAIWPHVRLRSFMLVPLNILMLDGENGEFIPMVNSGVGVGPAVGALLERVGVQCIARWLPFDTSEDEIRQYVLNRMLHPHVLPTTQRELQITHAFAREALTS